VSTVLVISLHLLRNHYFVFRMFVTLNVDYVPKHYSPTSLYKWHGVFFVRYKLTLYVNFKLDPSKVI